VLHGGSYGGKDGPGCIHRGGGRPTVLTVGVGDICVFTHLTQHLVVPNPTCSAYDSVLPALSACSVGDHPPPARFCPTHSSSLTVPGVSDRVFRGVSTPNQPATCGSLYRAQSFTPPATDFPLWLGVAPWYYLGLGGLAYRVQVHIIGWWCTTF
jgi:hypothetical protein